MTPVIYSTRIATSELQPLIKLCHFSVEARMLLESLPPHVVTKRTERQNLLLFRFIDPTFPFATYNTGRVFQEEGELRWEQEEGQDFFRVVYIGNPGALSSNVEAILRDYHKKHKSNLELSEQASKKKDELSPELPELAPERKEYYLFGLRLEKDELEMIGPPAQPGDFAVARIHRLLRYALKNENAKGPICFIVEELSDKATGQLLLFRFVGLDEEKKEVKVG